MVEKIKKSTKGMIVGAAAILIIIGIVLAVWIPSRAEDSRRAAFEEGYYAHAYEVLEDSWDDSRVELVRTALIISTCEEENLGYCNIMKRERDRLLAREIPEKLDEGDIGTYQTASLRADALVMQIDNAIKQNDYYIDLIYESGIDDDLAEIIGVTVREAESSRASLYLAELGLITDPDNTDLREAKEHLESAYAEYEKTDLPTDWGFDDVEAALDELREARRVLDEELFLD